MFNPFDHEDTDLDEAIASAFQNLEAFKTDEPGYQTTVDQLSKLYKLKNDTAKLNLEGQTASAKQQLDNDQNAWKEELDQRPFYARVDPNTLLTVAGNLLIGLAVIKYEQTGVISSKVMTFMKKI